MAKRQAKETDYEGNYMSGYLKPSQPLEYSNFSEAFAKWAMIIRIIYKHNGQNVAWASLKRDGNHGTVVVVFQFDQEPSGRALDFLKIFNKQK